MRRGEKGRGKVNEIEEQEYRKAFWMVVAAAAMADTSSIKCVVAYAINVTDAGFEALKARKGSK